MTMPIIKIATESDEASMIDLLVLALARIQELGGRGPIPINTGSIFVSSLKLLEVRRSPTRAHITSRVMSVPRCGFPRTFAPKKSR